MPQRFSLCGAAGARHGFGTIGWLPLVVMGKAIGADVPHARTDFAVTAGALPASLS